MKLSYISKTGIGFSISSLFSVNMDKRDNKQINIFESGHCVTKNHSKVI